MTVYTTFLVTDIPDNSSSIDVRFDSQKETNKVSVPIFFISEEV